MSDNKSVISGEFDRTGRYEAGLKSLANSLRAAFLVLLLGIIGTLIYFFSGAGYFSVEPQQSVIVLRFGKVVATHDSGGHWYLPFPVNQFIRVQTSQQLLNVDFVPATLASADETAICSPAMPTLSTLHGRLPTGWKTLQNIMKLSLRRSIRWKTVKLFRMMSLPMLSA